MNTKQNPKNQKPTHNIPLIYDNFKDTTTITNVMLIDDSVYQADIFYNSVSSNTLAIKYNYSSNREDLLNLLSSKFTTINRLCFVMSNGNYPYKQFINGESFFTQNDLSCVGVLSEN